MADQSSNKRQTYQFLDQILRKKQDISGNGSYANLAKVQLLLLSIATIYCYYPFLLSIVGLFLILNDLWIRFQIDFKFAIQNNYKIIRRKMAQNTSKPKIMVQNISCILPEQSNLGGLFLGNVYGAQNPTILKEYGIRAVLTSSIETDIKYSPLDIPFHIQIQAHDNQNYNLKEKINQCIHFIEQARKFTNVYIHCFAGVSRSAAIVCAYIMWKLKWNYQTTISFVKAKRVVAKPNQGFIKQLNQIQQILINPSYPKQAQTESFNQNYQQNYYQCQIKSQQSGIPARITTTVSPSVSPNMPPNMSPSIPPIISVKNQKQQLNRYLARQQMNMQGNYQPYMREASSYENYGHSNFGNIQQQLKHLDINKNVQNIQQSSKQNPLGTIASTGENKMKSTIYQPQKPNNYAYLQNVFLSKQGQEQAVKRVQNPAGKPIKKEANQQSSMKINNVASNSMNYPSKNLNFYKVSMSQNLSSKVNTINTSRQSNSNQEIILGGKKNIHNHISIPIPRLSEKKESTQASYNLNRAQSQFYQLNSPLYKTHDSMNKTHDSKYKTHQSKEFQLMNSNDFTSPPKYNMNDKYSITGMQSPRGNNIYNTNLDFRSSAPTEGFYNSKSKLQNKEVQKTMSRCLVKPKDLPGYKHYF